jgi:hypothetical protein
MWTDHKIMSDSVQIPAMSNLKTLKQAVKQKSQWNFSQPASTGTNKNDQFREVAVFGRDLKKSADI